MTVVDLHPEELLDKDARGDLDAGERTRLEAHLARCAACRFERLLRADFVSDLAEEIQTPGLAELGGIDRAVAPVAAPSGARIAIASRPRRVRKRAAWLLAVAALLVGGAAAAAMSLNDGPWPRLRSALELAPAPAAPGLGTPAKAARRGGAAAPSPVESAGVDEGTVTAAAASVETPAALSPAPFLAAAAGPRSVAVRSTRVAGPAELFEAEGDARRHQDYAQVFELHRRLEARYADSREARVSQAIVGRLLLDRGDPAGALANFDGYVAAGSGDLAEEVMIGRATALDRFGRGDDAARAWSTLLAAFPASPYAAHARARVESLNGK